MAALRKHDVAVTLEAAGFKITDDGLKFLLDDSAERFVAAWRQLNCERNTILDAFDRAGPDVNHQFDAAMVVIHELLFGIGIPSREPPSGSTPAFGATAGTCSQGFHNPEPTRAPAAQNRAEIQAAT
jgi:hypothetical protein